MVFIDSVFNIFIALSPWNTWYWSRINGLFASLLGESFSFFKQVARGKSAKM